MKPVVFCKPTAKGEHTFYIKTQDGTKYLFVQDFRRGVHNFFSRGVSVNQVFNASLKDAAICHTAKKLSSHLRYIQKEYEVQLLNDDKRKHKYTKSKIKTKSQRWDDSWDDYIACFASVA